MRKDDKQLVNRELKKAMNARLSAADKDQVAIVAAGRIQSPPELGKTPKGRKAVKAGGPSYEGVGHRDAAALWAADQTAGTERVKVLMHMGALFHALGWGEKKNAKDKKQPFHPTTESYFAGMTKFRDELPEDIRRSFNPRISEARRVMAGYLTKGKAEMDALLGGPGSYHQKIGSLKPRTERQATTPSATVADVAKAATVAERVKLVSTLQPAAVGEIMAGITLEQLPFAAKALSIHCTQLKGTLAAKLHKAIDAVLKQEEKHLKAA